MRRRRGEALVVNGLDMAMLHIYIYIFFFIFFVPSCKQVVTNTLATSVCLLLGLQNNSRQRGSIHRPP